MKDYKKILEGVVNIINTTEKSDIGFADIRAYIGENCPELKESEDEKVEKAIFAMVYDSDNELWSSYGVSKGDILAWLEKQKSIDVLDKEEREFADNVDSYRKDMDEFYKKGYNAGREAEKQYWLGKQGEQKPVDKVEPKFKVGDWAVSNLDKEARQISEVHFDEYNSYYVVNGKCVNLEEYDRLHHLWTIQDAKDGDVLACGNDIVIFKENNYNPKDQSGCMFVYCSCKNFYEIGGINPTTYKPASKEQREQLEKAMADSGFTFDFEKKELKKIEQNPVWSEEDEKRLESIIEECSFHKGRYKHGIEESAYYTLCEKNISWLKSLKDRVHPQPKQEWSEEDEGKFSFIRAILIDAKSPNNCASNSTYYREVTELIEWLKSLRPQNTWKPSDEQMKALDNFIYAKYPNIEMYGAAVKSLYDDLMKLK